MKSESDQSLLRSVIDYERSYRRCDIQFVCDFSEVMIILIPSEVVRHGQGQGGVNLLGENEEVVGGIGRFVVK